MPKMLSKEDNIYVYMNVNCSYKRIMNVKYDQIIRAT